MLTVIPFTGFYCSQYSDAMDNSMEQFAEEHSVPTDRLFSKIDYRKAEIEISKEYVEAYNEVFKEEYNIDLGLVFESLSSPREYNFETDRIFATMNQEALVPLFNLAVANGLEKEIKRLFTSRDGFISHYDPSLTEWLKTPIENWDHNQIYTLLTTLNTADDIDLEEEVFEKIREQVEQAWQNSIPQKEWDLFDNLRSN